MRFATRGFVDAMSPTNFAADQSRGDRSGRSRPAARACSRACRTCWPTCSSGQLTHTDAERVRGRAQPGDDAGQGGQPHAAVRTDPVYADDRDGARDAAGHLPAVDQPLLHPRPDAREELHPLGGRAGADRVHGVVEVGRRVDDRTWSGTIMSPRRSTRSTRCATCSTCRGGPHDRLLRRRAPRSPRRWRCWPRGARRTKVASATFFTAQVDFANAGELHAFRRRRAARR